MTRDLDLVAIKGLLRAGEADGRWHVEEGCTSDDWARALTASTSRIKAAVEQLLADSSYRQPAQRLARAIADSAGDTDPVTTIEKVLTGRTAPRPEYTTVPGGQADSASDNT